MDARSNPTFAPGRASLALALTAALVSTGCAGLTTARTDAVALSAIDLDRPEMRQFAVASTTDLERDVRIETSGDKRRREKLTPALFWTGIVLGAAGTAGSIGFGVAGSVTRNQLSDGYGGDGLTVDDRDALVSRGEGFDSAAIGFAAAAVIGFALSIVTYGVDWNRCGPLVRKRRRCKELGLAE